MPDAIPHLSLSVSDLKASEAFYGGTLAGRVGRRAAGWIDVWVFGFQLTLHRTPRAVTPSPYREAMHFGATVGWGEWPDWLDRLERARSPMAMPPLNDGETEKIHVTDPDGYVIEIKAYRDPVAMLDRPD